MSRMNHILIVVSIVVFIANITIASDWRGDAKAIAISGGENHTLVLTHNKVPWACGHNGWYQLGTGDNDNRLTLIRVEDGNMVPVSEHLEDINDVDAGWMHSLALEGYNPNDPNYNGYVWAWGWNEQGQLGNAGFGRYQTEPVQVLHGEQADDPCQPSGYLSRIIGISAGRSGAHSLAVDANGYVYGWGYNVYGQCGNGESGAYEKELVPVHVHQGDQPNDPCDSTDRLKHIIAVSAGENHSMGLEKDDPADANFQGCVYTWGEDYYGAGGDQPGVLGIGEVGGSYSSPVCVLSGEQENRNIGLIASECAIVDLPMPVL